MNHTTNITQSDARRSTYSLLVGSEEKSRSVFEIAIFAAVILSSVVSIWQVAQQRVTVPSQIGISSMAAVAQATPTQNS
jgi:hypothetical protein